MMAARMNSFTALRPPARASRGFGLATPARSPRGPLTSAAGRIAALALLLAALGASAGCEAPAGGATAQSKPAPSIFHTESESRKPGGEIDADRVAPRDDIVGIRQYWSQLPWLRRGDRIVGFQATVYFVSGETGKGAFVPGRIFAWVYEVPHAAPSEGERTLLYMWELDEKQAMGFRVRRVAVMGYYYGMVLAWDESTQIEGKTVDIVFGYQRRDGSIVEGAAKRFKVPVSGAAPAAAGAARG